MPSRFPEYPGSEFLDFAEACDLLPEEVVKTLLVLGIGPLEPYARWDGVPALRPVPRAWLSKGPSHPMYAREPALVEALYLHSLLVAHDASAHGGPTDPLEVYFFRERVEEAASMLVRVPLSVLDVELPPWVAWKGRWPKGGRPPAPWHEQVTGAPNLDEAIKRLPPLPEGMERLFMDNSGTKRIRVGPDKDNTVSLKHFERVRRKPLNPGGE